MKDILYIFVLAIMFTANISCAQSPKEEKQIISMLREFYTAHTTLWTSPLALSRFESTLSRFKFDNKLDSLQEIYCTKRVRIESKKYRKLGFDLLSNDFTTSIEKLKSTLKIVRDTTKENTYIVSYIIEIGYPSKPREEEHFIHLVVVKENDSYKIGEL